MFIGSRKRNKGLVIITKKEWDKLVELSKSSYFGADYYIVRRELNYLYKNINVDELIEEEKKQYGDDYSSIENWKNIIERHLERGIRDAEKALELGVKLINLA